MYFFTKKKLEFSSLLDFMELYLASKVETACNYATLLRTNQKRLLVCLEYDGQKLDQFLHNSLTRGHTLLEYALVTISSCMTTLVVLLSSLCCQRGNLFLFDLILYVHSTIFQLCGTGLPGLNQY